MSKLKFISAIDIGSAEVTTLIAQLSSDQVTFETSINIVGFSSVPSMGVKKGQIVNIEEAVESTIISVEGAERMAGLNLDRALVSVGGGHISSQNSKGVVAVSDPDGEVSSGDVERVIEAASAVSLPVSREIIHVLPREYLVDGESGVRDPIGMSGVRLEVDTHLITASGAALKNLEKTVREVGVEVEDVVFTGLASSYATLTETEKELGCVLVDIGAGTTSIAAFIDGALTHSASIPIGGKNVTNDLAIGLRVSIEQAEKIKLLLSSRKKKVEAYKKETLEIVETGSKKPKKISERTLTEGIIRPRLSEIFTMVKLELDQAGLINKTPSGIILTGGSAQTIGAKDMAKRVLALPVRVAKPGGVGGLIDDVIEPRFSVAVGLILFGAKVVPERKSSPGFSFARGLKLPRTNFSFSKIVNTIRDLLP